MYLYDIYVFEQLDEFEWTWATTCLKRSSIIRPIVILIWRDSNRDQGSAEFRKKKHVSTYAESIHLRNPNISSVHP